MKANIVASIAITRRSPKQRAGACWPSFLAGRVTRVRVTTSGAGAAS